MENPKTCAYRLENIYKMSDNSTDQSESHEIYASMACICSNAESPSRYFGDSSQLTTWILDSVATYQTATDISDFILVSMAETDKYIEVVDGNLVTEKKKG